MQPPASFLVQQSSVAESKWAKSKCLAGDLVETGVCQFVIEVPQSIGMKPGSTGSPSDGSQYSPDAALEGLQGGIEYGIEDLMQRPVVVGGDDQMPARLQDTEDFSQRLRQRDEPLGHANHHNELKRGIREWHIVDVAHLR
jgi:hypothetical protein